MKERLWPRQNQKTMGKKKEGLALVGSGIILRMQVTDLALSAEWDMWVGWGGNTSLSLDPQIEPCKTFACSIQMFPLFFLEGVLSPAVHQKFKALQKRKCIQTNRSRYFLSNPLDTLKLIAVKMGELGSVFPNLLINWHPWFLLQHAVGLNGNPLWPLWFSTADSLFALNYCKHR